MVTRREFLDALAVGAAGLAVGTTAKSYGQILGSNDRLNFAVIGLNGRAYAHLASLNANRSAAIKTNHGTVEPVIRTKNLAVTFCRGSYGKPSRPYGEGIEKFTSRNHKFSL